MPPAAASSHVDRHHRPCRDANHYREKESAPCQINGIGFTLSDKPPGPFRLELDRGKTVPAAAPRTCQEQPAAPYPSNRLRACRAAIAFSVLPKAPETRLASSRSSMEICSTRPATRAFRPVAFPATGFPATLPAAAFFSVVGSGRFLRGCVGILMDRFSTPSSFR